MFNVGGGEFFVILLLALVVLGPDKLPGAMRTVGQWAGEMRKMANGFQSQMNDAMKAPVDAKSAEKAPKAGTSDTAASNGSSATADAPKTDVAAPQDDPSGDTPAAEAE